MKKQITLVPMAGAGSRFAQEGYTDPKPLILVDDLPMIVRAVQDFPKSDEYIFVCRTEHLRDYPLEKTLKEYFPNSRVVEVDHLTEGQASTCLLAEKYLDPEAALLIIPCDNGMTYDQAKWDRLVNDPSVDGLVISYRGNVNVERKPQAHGWVVVDGHDVIQKVSVKVPISENPINDHAVLGAFWFRKSSDFVAAANDMIAKGTRVNGEFYVDELINNAIGMGKKMMVFEADKSPCWGTPADLKTYNYWKDYFLKEYGNKNGKK